MSIHIFGIRHHGPGSARSLLKSLHALQPDIVLVEGPPEGNDALALLAHEDMQPPVALLIYAPEQSEQAAYYPFAVFSPEWQAIQYGLKQNIPVRFMDLPQTHQMAERLAQQQPQAKSKDERSEEEKNEESDRALETEGQSDGSPKSQAPVRPIPADPLAWLAEAAGYSDSERWWEHMVEQRQDNTEIFEAILEAMSTLRQEIEQTHPSDLENPRDRREAKREAYMRRTIRQAKKEGFETIAAICGAWHSPALCEPLPAQKHDNALLKGLPKLKVKATWIPWTYGRLSSATGYGAGINSPGWYDHLWQSSRPQKIAIGWMTQVARLLRQEDIDASSASVIEAVRLAEALAAMRESAMPGLDELSEATQTVLCFGDATPMQLIHQKLIVSERLGRIPAETPLIPLQQDLQRLQKRLRLKPEANERLLTLDLRKEIDLERSHLLHRLSLLDIPWGQPQTTSGKGTFKEAWQLRWQPELSLAVIESGRWGNTIGAAAQTYAKYQVDIAPDLPALTNLLDNVLLAALPDAVTYLLSQLQAMAAVSSDIAHLMAALPPLANVLRYRDVRQTDGTIVAQVIDGLVARICIGLPGACASLDDDAAAAMLKAINQTNSAIKLLQNGNHGMAWSAVLLVLCDKQSLHGLIAGRCCRLLLDEGSLEPEKAAQRMGLALSLANAPTQAAAWVEGFLQGSGLLLLHDDIIWQVLDDWVTSLTSEQFTALLPLLRRTFTGFSPPERRQMGERVRAGSRQTQVTAVTDFDTEHAESTLPLIAQLLGLQL
ncbi:hypothetical protein Lepto7375DRAFT_5778 [Leptolyngbya sp. PCC 7375]|nr:hypothetical protein Lepto7375DRAFT_5778 [Leptolyngbya sp. PCC 7375]